MKKLIIVTAAALALFISCGTSPKPIETPTDTPVAQVDSPKQVTITVWLPTTLTVAYADGIISSVIKTDYDESGKPTNETTLDGKKNLISARAWTWSGEDGAIIVATNAVGSPTGKTEISYAEGRPVKETMYDAKGAVQSTDESAYDADGNRSSHTVTTGTGGGITTKYDIANGKVKTITILDATGSPIKRFERAFNPDGTIAAESEFDADATLKSVIAYAYSDGKLVKEETRSPTGIVRSRIEYVNDENGNPITAKLYDRQGKLAEVRTTEWKGFSKTIISK